MNRRVSMILVLVVGLAIGVAATAFRALPTEDMVARASCAQCHDLHGAIEWEDAPTQTQIWIMGDVAEATYIIVSDLFPYASEQEGTGISLPDLLDQYGAGDWERVAIESLDGGIVIFEREYVTEESLLVPYLEGVRFKDANQHESTWLKGVRWITVVGQKTPLNLFGTQTSIGRLLLGSRVTIIAEGGDAMYVSPLDGETYKGDYAHLYTGAALSGLMPEGECSHIIAVDGKGNETEYACADLEDAIIGTANGEATLILPEFGRSKWVIGLVELRAEP